MGIVIKQSIKNTIITYIGFAIGAINSLYLYIQILGKIDYGVVSVILSSANILFPFMAFGLHNTLVKFYNEYNSDKEKSQFLTLILLLPLVLSIPIFILIYFNYNQIVDWITIKNPELESFVWQIPLIGLCMGYFEIFYAWAKVHMHSVVGNFLKEIGLRILISLLLFGVYFEWISANQFINYLCIVYLVIVLVMKWYAFSIYKPKLSFSLPTNFKNILIYSSYIFLTGSIANLLLDIDKSMLNFYIEIEKIAYYSVAIFIATVIAVPSRAMHQITYPITAKLMSENKVEELNILYKKTSITLQIIGGLILVGILVNIHQLYELLPVEYSQGLFVVFVIGFSKYLDLILGNNNSIIFNSKYYKTVLLFGIILVLLMILLNLYFIPKFGIDGAAIATLISISLYSLIKLLFVVKKMKLFPFSWNTLKSFGILLLIFALFYFWEFSFLPIINIVLKSILVTISYLFLHYFFNISLEINEIINKFNKRIKK